MIKKILLVVLILGAIGVGTGIYLFYKPSADAGGQKGVPVTAEVLARDYAADEAKANGMYLGKVLEVSGKVGDVSKNQDGAVVVTFDTGDPMNPVQCTMEDKGVVASKGEQLVVNGFCNGSTMGVVLNRGVIVKK